MKISNEEEKEKGNDLRHRTQNKEMESLVGEVEETDKKKLIVNGNRNGGSSQSNNGNIPPSIQATDGSTCTWKPVLPPSETISNFGATVLQLVVMFGVAPIILPYTVVECGGSVYVWCTVLICVTATIAYCLQLQKECVWVLLEHRKLLRKHSLPRDPYPAMMQLAGGKWARFAAGIMLSCVYCSSAISNMVASANTLQTSFPFSSDFSMATSTRAWTAIITVIILPVTFLGRFKDLTAAAALSVISVAICCILVAASSLIAHSYFGHAIMPSPLLATGSSMQMRAATFPSLVAVVSQLLLIVGGGGVLLPNIMCEMRQPDNPTCSMFTPFVISIPMYGIAALIPFFVFRNLVQANILSTLHELPIPLQTYEALLILTELTITFHLMANFVVNINPIYQQVEKYLHCPRELCWQRLLVRTLGIFILLIVALLIPTFDVIATFVGGVFMNIVVVVMPIYMYACIFQDDLSWMKKGILILISACSVTVIVTNFVILFLKLV